MNPLKYGIKEVIDDNYSTRKERKAVRQLIRSACRISAQTLCLWENYPHDSESMIPADQLYKVSLILKVRMEELFNKNLVNSQ